MWELVKISGAILSILVLGYVLLRFGSQLIH